MTKSGTLTATASLAARTLGLLQRAREGLGRQEASSRTDATGGQRVLALAERFALLVILLGLIVMFGLMNSTFISWANWQSIFSSQAVLLVMALALMVPLIGGNFDLSVGAVAILVTIVVSGAESKSGASLLVSVALGLLIGTSVGVFNGFLVTVLRLNDLIATLGTSVIISGLINLYTGGNSIVSGISFSLTDFGAGMWLSIPKVAVLAIAIAIAVAYVVMKTPWGRKLAAVGSNKTAAQLVGIRVRRVVFTSFVSSAGLASLAGVLMLAQQGSGQPSADSISLLLPALAAVFLGASAFTPGSYNVPGSVIGLLVVAVLVSGLTLQGVAVWVQPTATGGALVAAVAASEAFRRRRQ